MKKFLCYLLIASMLIISCVGCTKKKTHETNREQNKIENTNDTNETISEENTDNDIKENNTTSEQSNNKNSNTATGHKHNYRENIVNATCTSNGKKTYSCTSCSHTYAENIPAQGHSWANATCTAAKKCQSCGATEGSALGHNYNKGTCTRCGETALGQVKGTVTYKYNQYVGSRGDAKASVLLIPINDQVKTYDNHQAVMFLTGTYESGIMVTKCDGYGNYDFNQTVPTGKYLIVIVSKETTGGERFTDEATWKANFTNTFKHLLSETDLQQFMTFVGYQKYTFKTLTIDKNKCTTISHDFGYTYI